MASYLWGIWGAKAQSPGNANKLSSVLLRMFAWFVLLMQANLPSNLVQLFACGLDAIELLSAAAEQVRESSSGS